MPSFKSNGGAWSPAQEKSVNIRTGEVYQGPDREAAQMIKDNGGRMGMESKNDPENIMRARQLNMSVEEYLKLGAPPEEMVAKAEEEKEKAVVEHKAPKRKAAVQTQGGGVTIKGGFGEQPNI